MARETLATYSDSGATTTATVFAPGDTVYLEGDITSYWGTTGTTVKIEIYDSADSLLDTPLDTTHNFTANTMTSIKDDINSGTAPSWATSASQASAEYYAKLTVGTEVLYIGFQVSGTPSAISITTDDDWNAGTHSKTMAENGNLYGWIYEDFADTDKTDNIDAFSKGTSWTVNAGYMRQYSATGYGSGFLASHQSFTLAQLGYFKTHAKLVQTEYARSDYVGIIDAASPLDADGGTGVMEVYIPYTHNTSIYIIYYDASGTYHYWNGTAWTTTSSAALTGVSSANEYRCEIIGTGTTLKVMVYDDADLLLAETDTVNISDIYSDTGVYWAKVGDQLTTSNILNKYVYQFELAVSNSYWVSDTITPPTGKKLKSLTITLSEGENGKSYLNGIEILDASNSATIDTSTDPIPSTTTLVYTDFTEELDPTLDTAFKIKVPIVNKGHEGVLRIASITGEFEFVAKGRTDGEVWLE